MLTLADLKDVLQAGNSAHAAILSPEQATTEAVAETLVAFANGRGGVLVIPLTDATTAPMVRERALSALLRSQPPLIVPLPYLLPSDAAPQALIVEVPDGLPNVYGLEGRYLIRDGAQNKPLDGVALHMLLLQRGENTWESLCPPDAMVEDLDLDKISAYARAMNETDWLGLLLRRGCVVRRGSTLHPTHAGLLLFGRAPQQWVRGAEILCARFQGTEMGDAFARQTIDGTLPEQIRRAEAFLADHLPRYARLTTWQRSDVPPYPPGVLREAVVNAVAHRDYRLTGSQIHVLIFSDRVEVRSPGRLPGHVTLDNLLRERYSRNEAIVQVLADLGFIERLGYGIDRMVRAMREAGHPEPLFEETDGGFAVTLFARAPIREVTPAAVPLSPQQVRIQKMLSFLEQHGRITSREYQELCPEVNAETLRRDFNEMVERGVILRIGDKRGTYYILK
ncbi:MAG: ATP-binding protein [Anaerolineae bacterium]|nr:DeoR family transcriptional regulator [Thermoflexales bacterium]MDW8395099.1 ATP-binding protein [Anaerolineae bacterium]